MKKLILLSILAVTLAEKSHTKSAEFGSHGYLARPYSFKYHVKDDATYNDYGHEEDSNGKVVTGSYRVLLPDGRVQIVSYKVDESSGYVSKVTYEETAKYSGEKSPFKTTNSASVSSSSFAAPHSYPIIPSITFPLGAPVGSSSTAPVTYPTVKDTYSTTDSTLIDSYIFLPPPTYFTAQY